MSDGYGEDAAYNSINEDILEQEFSIDTTQERQDELEEVRQMRQDLAIAINDSNPDEVLFRNIERANKLLDALEDKVLLGSESTNARLYEVCGQLINAITTASATVMTNSQGNLKHEHNMKLIDLKEKELIIKGAIAQEKAGNGGGSTTGSSGRVIVTDRESLLKMMKEEEDADVEITTEPMEDQNTEN